MWESRENEITLCLRIPKLTMCYTSSALLWKNRSLLWSGIAPVRVVRGLKKSGFVGTGVAGGGD